MSFTNDERDKIQPAARVRELWPILALIIPGCQILVAIGALPFLPPIVPIHWNALGHPDRYASKWVNTLLFPGIGIFIYLLLHYIPSIGPHLGSRASTFANSQVRVILQVTLLLFTLIIQLLVTSISFGMAVDFPLVMNLAISALFIVIGNYLGKVRRNFWMGVRTPWTLASPSVWERTHRLGSWLFVAAGLLGLLCSFIPPLRPWGLLASILIASLFLYIYSYICYQQQIQAGREPLSPPFDGE